MYAVYGVLWCNVRSLISRVSSRTLTYGGPASSAKVPKSRLKKPAQTRKIHVHAFYKEDGTPLGR